jgi:translation initiation factor 3 subunit B
MHHCRSMPRDRFGQLSWRPRVPSLLPREKEEEIRKNLKEYSRRYDEEDEALLLQVSGMAHFKTKYNNIM